MAEADMLTANLRANPIFYADTQLIPYGHFSFLRPGGPPQSDININYPAGHHLQAAGAHPLGTRGQEASPRPSSRTPSATQIDNLYTVYVDVVAAGLTLKFSETYADGHPQTARLTTSSSSRRDKSRNPTSWRSGPTLTRPSSRSGSRSRRRSRRTAALALMLNMPLDDVGEARRTRPHRQAPAAPHAPRRAGHRRPSPTRPDLIAIKFGVRRAEADLRLARANGYPDVYVLYQPYTFQNNTYLGVPSAYSWTLGLTATIPLYNRNQGNITRAKINITQTEIQVASAERIVDQRRSERGPRARTEPGRASPSSGARSSRPPRRSATRPSAA